MKRPLLLVLSLFVAQLAFAQIEQATEASPEVQEEDRFRNLRHSVGFGIVGGGETSGKFFPMPGLGYKYYTDEGAFRVMVGGLINTNTSDGGWGFSSYDESAFNVHLGYQYHVMLGRFMPIIGVDLAAGVYERKASGPNYLEKQKNAVFGLSPNVGLELFITNRLSFLIDTRFDVSYKDSYSLYEFSDGWQDDFSKTRTQGMQTHISAISSFMAIFHF